MQYLALLHFISRLRRRRMSFTNKPMYVPWKPNKEFIKFFEDMKKRRITATANPTMKVTDTPTRSPADLQMSNFQPIKYEYSTMSESLVNTAKGQMRLCKDIKKCVNK